MNDIISDYKTELSDKINDLFDDIRGNDGEFRSPSYRIITCDELIEDYIEISGEVPPSNTLDRMATYIIKEDKKRRKGRKVVDEGDYPILSDRQYESRLRREAPDSRAEHYDSDGINRQIPTRALRIESELKLRKVK